MDIGQVTDPTDTVNAVTRAVAEDAATKKGKNLIKQAGITTYANLVANKTRLNRLIHPSLQGRSRPPVLNQIL